MQTGKLTAILLFSLASVLSAAPRLVLSAVAVGPVNVSLGTNGTTQTVEAFNAGDGNLNLATSASASWLSATVGASRACTTRAGNCLPVNIALSTSGLTLGNYTESITLTDPNSVDTPQQIFVTVAIVGVPSSLSLYVTPANGGVGSLASVGIYPKGQVTGAVATTSGGKWLAFTSAATGIIAAGAPYYVQAAAQNGQAVGTYNGTVTISGSSNASDNKTMAVSMTVTTLPIIDLSYQPIRVAGDTGGGKGAATLQFINAGLGSLAITAASATSSSGSFLSASVAAPDTILVQADPTGLSAGIYTGTVTITSNAANNSQVSVPVSFTVNAAGTPQISAGGIVNVANFAQESVSPGEILAAFGDQLAAPGTLALNTGLPPLATTLGGVQVLVNGVPAPLYFSTPGQVNFQLPYEAASGSVATVQVISNGTPGNIRSVNVTATAPRMMVWGANVISGGYGIIVNQDYSLTLPSTTSVQGFVTHPAKVGDTITIYAVGLGQTSPGATTGAAATSNPLEKINNATVTFGGVFQGTTTVVPASFAGLTPTQVGLYQVNVQIPPTAPIGPSVPVTLAVNGVVGNYVYLAISK